MDATACVYPPTTPTATLKQIGGNPEGGRMTQILAASKRCQVQEAIAKARATYQPPPCPGRISRKDVPLESTALQGQLATCARISAADAQRIVSQSLRGVPESIRIAQMIQTLQDQTSPYSDSSRRFLEYRGPVVPVACPPLPTEILNANIPKPSTRCDTLALLATGATPNNLPRP